MRSELKLINRLNDYLLCHQNKIDYVKSLSPLSLSQAPSLCIRIRVLERTRTGARTYIHLLTRTFFSFFQLMSSALVGGVVFVLRCVARSGVRDERKTACLVCCNLQWDNVMHLFLDRYITICRMRSVGFDCDKSELPVRRSIEIGERHAANRHRAGNNRIKIQIRNAR